MTDARHAPPHDWPTKTVWRRGRLLALLAVVVTLLLLLHDVVPSRWGVGSLVETFLPWFGLVVPLVLLGSLVRRSATAAMASLLPTAAWLWLFLPQLPAAEPVAHDLAVVQHNVSDTNQDVEGTAATLLAAQPDVVTLVEVTPEQASKYTRAFGDALPHHVTQGTVGVWSRVPLRKAEPVDLRPTGIDATWDRGVRMNVVVGEGQAVRLYAVHLPSVRVGTSGVAVESRDESIAKLAEAVAADESEALVVAGDLNTVLDDRALDPLTSLVTAPRHGFGFTYPAVFPVAAIDHVLARGAEVVAITPLGRTESDHLPVVAHLTLPAR